MKKNNKKKRSGKERGEERKEEGVRKKEKRWKKNIGYRVFCSDLLRGCGNEASSLWFIRMVHQNGGSLEW